jgi:thioredoxin 1
MASSLAGEFAPMTISKPYLSEIEAPSRVAVDAMPGLVLLEFGISWCGHCRAAQAGIAEALSHQAHWRHLKIEDGPGRRLGRSFGVKLCPTLVILRDGQEVGRVIRPTQMADITAALASG